MACKNDDEVYSWLDNMQSVSFSLFIFFFFNFDYNWF